MSRRSLAVRALSLVTLGATLLGTVAFVRDAPTAPQRLYADPGLISPGNIARFNEYLSQIHDESGVDVRIIYTSKIPGGDLESFALNRLRSLGVGRSVDRRGLVFVYDVERRRLRVEVGPGLDGVITDGFAGYLMRDHAAGFFAMGDKVVGLRTTMFMVHRRIREAALGQQIDPRVMTFITDSVRLASGAGATTRVASAEAATSSFIGRVSTAAERAHYAPQPTVAGSFARYLEWLRDGKYQTDLPLFTVQTHALLRGLPWTRAYNDYVLYGEYGQRFTVDVRGPRAMLVFTSTPFISPHFFRRTAAGWQMDLAAEVTDTREYGGGAHTWGMAPNGDDFSHVYADRFVDFQGITRLSGGDNRPLPTHLKR